MPVFLWSDILVFMMLGILAISFILATKNVTTKARWLKVYQKPTRIISFVILVTFLLIGMLDSMHFSSNMEPSNVKSVLDILLEPISNHTESSYSAPFASNLFVKVMRGSDGEIEWIAEPLHYVTNIPIKTCLLHGMVIGLTIILILSLIIYILLRVKKVAVTRNISIAWVSTSVVILVISCCTVLFHNYHILGTDKIGIDVFYSSIKSIRTGLIIGILTSAMSLPFAVILGALAGFYGNVVDDIIQYIYTILSSIPSLLLIAAAMLSLDALISRNAEIFSDKLQMADARLLLLCGILGVTSWTGLCRIIRAETLKLRESGFVLSARALGLNSIEIIKTHIFPNLLHIILIAFILDFSGLVLAEAVLSYVGVGVDASIFSFGNMINGARMEMGRYPVIWWTLTGAFIMMFTLVLAANIFADGVRDAFDPKA